MTAAQPKYAVTDSAAEVRAHVATLHQLAAGIDGVLVVSTFHASTTADDRPGTVTHHPVGDVDGMVDAITAHLDTPHANVYVGLQVMRKGIARGKRGTEADIVAVLGLVADMDGDTGKVGDLPIEPNIILETSPGNSQPFWLFDRPLTPAEARPLAAALKQATCSDHGTADVAHVWRVPGTLNWPNRKKLERGRSPDPVSVTVAQNWDGSLTSIEALTDALAPWASAPSDSSPISIGDLPDVGSLAIGGKTAALLAANEVGDRSAHAARVVEQLAFDGHTAEEALVLFLSASGDWIAKYATEELARKDFERCWSKHGARHGEQRQAAVAMVGGLVEKAPPKPANDNHQQKWPGIISSGDLVRGFIPPDYHYDGIAQAGFLYGITAMTGTGKTAFQLLLAAHTALGEPLAGRDMRQGRVVYFAGENPDDVTMRWIAMAHHLDFDPDAMDVHFIKGTFSIPAMFARIEADVTKLGGAELIVVDTSAAYFQGSEENSNTELGRHARDLRTLTTLHGSPCVMVACHPTKAADQSNLLPRGGGAFLNELDGNLVLVKGDTGTIRLHWHGKHRGPDFDPVHFELKTVTAPALKDSRGRDVPTVMASALSSGEARERRVTARRDEDDVLLLIERDGGLSLSGMAETLGWQKDGAPDKRRASSATEKLKKSKLAEYVRGKWRLTKSGIEAAVDIKTERHATSAAAGLVSRMVSQEPSE